MAVLAGFYSIKIGSLLTTGISATTIAALYFLLSQIGRDRGKANENQLWKDWDGAPSIQMLRYSDATLTKLTKKRYHAKLQALSPVDNLPTEEFERANAEAADEIYQHWCKYIISHTRDNKKFSLLYRENVNYGFRRNLWGLKPFAITLILITGTVSATYFLSKYGFKVMLHDYYFIGIHIGIILLLLLWALIVTRNWIRIPAFAYAERLAEAVEELKAEG